MSAVLLKIAVRNVFAHKIKTIIIGTIISIGIFITVVGNSLLDSAQSGMEKAYVKSMTGQISISINRDFDFSFFGKFANMGNTFLPAVSGYFDVIKYLESRSDIECVTPVSAGYSVINWGETDNEDWLFSFGVEPESYTKMFNIDEILIFEEGGFLEPGEEGIVIAKKIVDEVERYRGRKLRVGDKILLDGFTPGSIRIREIPIKGIFTYRYIKGDEIMPMVQRASFIDIKTFRILNGYTIDSNEDFEIDEEDAMFFSSETDSIFDDTSIESGIVSEESGMDIEDILGDLSARHAASQTDSGAWQWIIFNTKYKSGKQIKKVINEIKDHFKRKFIEFDKNDFNNFDNFISKIKNSKDPVIKYIREEALSEKTMDSINSGPPYDKNRTMDLLVRDINRLIRKNDFYREDLFKNIFLSDITKNLVKKNPSNEECFRMNRLLLEEVFPLEINRGADVHVSDWWLAAAPMSMITMGIKLVLNIAMIIIVVVMIIIIMNTLIISVMERTSEIGTMRAIGGQKIFILKMFILETLTISMLFGCIGLLVGSGFIYLINLIGIKVPEGTFLEMILAGNILRPVVSVSSITQSFIFMIVIGLFSCLYPVFFALKIRPVKAIELD